MTPETIFLFGTDSLGRDMYSRTLYGSRISLTIGLVGVAISFVLGCLLGGVSGYFGGAPDMVIQRIIEFLQSLPTLPLWMALAAAVPTAWPPIRIYFMITVILSIVGWTGLAPAAAPGGRLRHGGEDRRLRRAAACATYSPVS